MIQGVEALVVEAKTMPKANLQRIVAARDLLSAVDLRGLPEDGTRDTVRGLVADLNDVIYYQEQHIERRAYAYGNA